MQPELRKRAKAKAKQEEKARVMPLPEKTSPRCCASMSRMGKSVPIILGKEEIARTAMCEVNSTRMASTLGKSLKAKENTVDRVVKKRKKTTTAGPNLWATRIAVDRPWWCIGPRRLPRIRSGRKK